MNNIFYLIKKEFWKNVYKCSFRLFLIIMIHYKTIHKIYIFLLIMNIRMYLSFLDCDCCVCVYICVYILVLSNE